MTESDFTKAEILRLKIKRMKEFLVGIDPHTKGTLGHTGFLSIKCHIKKTWFFMSMDNHGYVDIVVPEEIIQEVVVLSHRELDKMEQELRDL